MENISTKVKLYLEANGKSYDSERLINFNLRDDGSGAFIEDWSVDGVTKPTDVELDALESEANAEDKLNGILSNRRRNYPSVSDQLDMQYHDQLDGTTTWKDAVAKVKSDNPKDSK
jgi:hypothetical protein